MNFGVAWDSEANDDFDRIAKRYPLVASRILDEIERLAQDPVGISRPPSFPHPLMPKHQFWAEDDTARCYVTVLFQYSVNERDIIIRKIGITVMPLL